MSAEAIAPEVHPLHAVASCLEAIGDALDGAPTGPIPEADPDTLEVVVAEAARLERRVRELRLRLSRTAEVSGVAQSDASSGADAWLARLTGTTAAVMRGGLWLARMLEDRYPAVRAAFAAGGLSEAHARIIVRTAEEMPASVSEADRAEAVRALVAHAVEGRINTRALRRRARRMLAVISAAYADQHEAALLAKEHDHARNETWLALDDNGDGTWSGRFVVPELQAQLLLTHLQHLSSPRRMSRNLKGERVVDATVPDWGQGYGGFSWSRALGNAFVELCEHLPTDGLAQHGRVGATVVVHLDHQRLLDGLRGAALDSGSDISVGEARRLACGAGLIPAVYGGASVPLDLGRESRLHTKAQRIALSARHETCATEGCERPFAWCEIHHPHAWALGGKTDLTGLPLCGWHHRRAHDDTYDMRELTSGEVRFRRRRRRPAQAAPESDPRVA